MKIENNIVVEESEGIYHIYGDVGHDCASMSESGLRELIVYLKKNRPELICPIMCEDCAESNARVASHNYFYCAREHGENSK